MPSDAITATVDVDTSDAVITSAAVMPSAAVYAQPSPHSSSPSSAYPSMKQFTFPITAASQPSPSSATATATSRPPSAQRNRAGIPVRPTLSQSSFPQRASTAASAANAGPMTASTSSPSLASEFDGVNARVDRKFAYWKSYWATVQQHAAATAADTTAEQQQHSEEKQQTSTAAAGARSREQLEAVIRRMRETREEEMATSKLNTPRDSTANDKAKMGAAAADKRGDMHDRRWDASPRLHRSETERKRTERRRTSDLDKKASGVEQPSKSAAEQRTEHIRSRQTFSASPPPSASRSSSYSTASTASSTPSAATSSTSSPSNLHRFWQDELHRQPHVSQPSHQPSHSTAQRTRRRKMEHLTLPADPEQARRLWEKMKLEMWQQWEDYQRNEDGGRRSGGGSRAAAGRKVRVDEEEKEPAEQPAASPLSASSFAAFSSSSPHFSPRASSHYVPPSTSSASAWSTSGRRSTEPAHSVPVGGVSGWSVRELRAELLRFNLSTHDCLEKSDMVDKLTRHHQQQQQRHSHTPPPLPSPAPVVVDADVIIAEVKRWSHNKSIVQLLNDLNRDTSTATASANATAGNTLQHDSSIEDVSRVYKKTLLRVHPDKCGLADEEKRVRATEVFKAIHDKFVQFRDRK